MPKAQLARPKAIPRHSPVRVSRLDSIVPAGLRDWHVPQMQQLVSHMVSGLSARWIGVQTIGNPLLDDLWDHLVDEAGPV
jgi:hypothetical protein